MARIGGMIGAALASVLVSELVSALLARRAQHRPLRSVMRADSYGVGRSEGIKEADARRSVGQTPWTMWQ